MAKIAKSRESHLFAPAGQVKKNLSVWPYNHEPMTSTTNPGVKIASGVLVLLVVAAVISIIYGASPDQTLLVRLANVPELFISLVLIAGIGGILWRLLTT